MERRIKLTDEQVRIVVDSLENTRDQGIDTKKHVIVDVDMPQSELTDLEGHIDQCDAIAAAFRDMLPEDEQA